jgi:salicylate hydroxylase
MLLDLAKSYMTLKLNSRVVSVEPQEGKVTLENGEVISGDLLIGADGIKSIVRDAVAGGRPKSPVPTGHAAYRAVISTKDMISDPDLKPLIDQAEMISWMGPGKHIIGYCIVCVSLPRKTRSIHNSVAWKSRV